MPSINVSRIASGRDVPIPASIRVTDLARSIEIRAHEIFLERGDTPADPLADWIQAEREKAGHARVNLYEEETGFHADFQLPGFEPDDIQVAISERQLGIHARCTSALSSHAGEAAILHEFSEGEAYRQLHFPSLVDPGTLDLHFADGVLHAHVKKACEPESSVVFEGKAEASES